MDKQQVPTHVRDLTGVRILASYKQDRENITLDATDDEWRAAISTVSDACRGRLNIATEQGANLNMFFCDMPAHLRPEAWGKLIMAGGELPDGKFDRATWGKSIHPYLVKPLVEGTFGVTPERFTNVGRAVQS